MAISMTRTGWLEPVSTRLAILLSASALIAALILPSHVRIADAAEFALGDSVTVDTDRLNLRAGPGTGATVVLVLSAGDGLTVTGASQTADGYTWYPVTGDAGSGWVAGELLRSGNAAASDTPMGGPAFSIGDRALTTDRLNFRTGPGTGNGIIRVLPTGTLLTITDGPVATGGYWWYQGRTTAATGGDAGWVIALGLGMAPTELPDPTVEYDAGSVVHVDADTLRLRSEPTTASTIVERLPYGTTITVTGGPAGAEGYTWYQVVTPGGGAGWVASDYIAWGAGASEDASAPVRAFAGTAIVDTPRLNVRAAPGTDASILGQLGGGAEVRIMGGPELASGYHWYLVELPDGATGWVIGEALLEG